MSIPGDSWWFGDQVKTNQRSSRPFAKAWRSYCDAHGDGFYDPARCTAQFCREKPLGSCKNPRHPTEFLEDFLKSAADKCEGQGDVNEKFVQSAGGDITRSNASVLFV